MLMVLILVSLKSVRAEALSRVSNRDSEKWFHDSYYRHMEIRRISEGP